MTEIESVISGARDATASILWLGEGVLKAVVSVLVCLVRSGVRTTVVVETY